MRRRTPIAKLTGGEVLLLLTNRWKGLDQIAECAQAAVERAGLEWDERIAGAVYLILEEFKGHGAVEREIDRGGYVYRLTTMGVAYQSQMLAEDAQPEPAVVIPICPPISVDRE